jgi:hypothetical protein
MHVRQLLATTARREIFSEDKQRTVIDVVPVNVVMQCVVDLQNDVENKWVYQVSWPFHSAPAVRSKFGAMG